VGSDGFSVKAREVWFYARSTSDSLGNHVEHKEHCTLARDIHLEHACIDQGRGELYGSSQRVFSEYSAYIFDHDFHGFEIKNARKHSQARECLLFFRREQRPGPVHDCRYRLMPIGADPRFAPQHAQAIREKVRHLRYG
tara:strand:- start:40 stop:456 length:417 start_codon:yes stop_codon:yes gene_type:complete